NHRRKQGTDPGISGCRYPAEQYRCQQDLHGTESFQQRGCRADLPGEFTCDRKGGSKQPGRCSEIQVVLPSPAYGPESTYQGETIEILTIKIRKDPWANGSRVSYSHARLGRISKLGKHRLTAPDLLPQAYPQRRAHRQKSTHASPALDEPHFRSGMYLLPFLERPADPARQRAGNLPE